MKQTAESACIEIKHTWTMLLPALLAAFESGTPEGRRMAHKELKRMAKAADIAVEKSA